MMALRRRIVWTFCCLGAGLLLAGAEVAAQNPYARQVPGSETKDHDPPGVPGQIATATGGPDGFGYTFIDSNEPGGPAFSWVDITATGSSVALGDDASFGPNPLFSFDFYGTTYTSYFINSNGMVTFGAGNTDFTNPCPMPDGIEPTGATIALMWDDLDPGDDGALAYWESFAAGACPYVPAGVAGTPACEVVLYEDYAHFPGPLPPTAGTFETIIYDSGEILVQFLDAGDETGSGSITGIAPGPALDGNGLTYACDTAGSVVDSLAVLFVPGAVGDLAITKTPDTDPIPIGGTFVYTIEVTNNGPDDQTGVTVTDDLPPELTFVGDTCGGMLMGSTWSWNIGALANGASASCDLTVELNSCATVTNTATVTGDAGDPSGDSSATVTSNQQVADGSFEAGTPNPSWAEASTNFGTPLCTVAGCGTGGGTGPRTGDWWAWFGGIGAFEEGSLSQSITIPSADEATLTFWLEVPVCDSPTDFMEVLLDGSQIFLVDGSSPLCGAIGYVQQTIDVSAFADGASHTLEFHSIITGTNGGPSNFFVDDVALAACPGIVLPIVTIPTLDGVGLAVLLALLAGAALVLLRRRRIA